MKISLPERTVHLTYCTNVHPSEDLVQILGALRGTVLALKQRLCPKAEFGLGLYLPAAVVQEFSENEYRRWEFDGFFKESGLYVFTLNCFPFGGFHGERVKERVFEPDWTTPERLDYTNKAAELLVRWLPEGVKGSISTHTGAYGRRGPGDPIWEKVAQQFAQAALHLHRLEGKTGKRIVLSLEPEPFAIVDSTPDFVRFYEDVLLRLGMELLGRSWGMSAADGEALLRRHLGACFDTCHFCVQYEFLENFVLQCEKEGIPIGKAQISTGLELREPDRNRRGLERLRAFAEPRYLHQTVLRVEEGPIVQEFLLPDLPQALAVPELFRAKSLRSHFHVPVYWEGDDELGTTRSEVERAFPIIAGATDHLEIETYTWDVLPEAERRLASRDLTTSIEKEIRWVLEHLPTSPVPGDPSRISRGSGFC